MNSFKIDFDSYLIQRSKDVHRDYHKSYKNWLAVSKSESLINRRVVQQLSERDKVTQEDNLKFKTASFDLPKPIIL